MDMNLCGRNICSQVGYNEKYFCDHSTAYSTHFWIILLFFVINN